MVRSGGTRMHTGGRYDTEKRRRRGGGGLTLPRATAKTNRTGWILVSLRTILSRVQVLPCSPPCIYTSAHDAKLRGFKNKKVSNKKRSTSGKKRLMATLRKLTVETRIAKSKNQGSQTKKKMRRDNWKFRDDLRGFHLPCDHCSAKCKHIS